MARLFHRFRLAQLWRAEAGNAAIVFALSAPLFIGGAALGVETSFDYREQTRLQAAADAAAFAAGLENSQGGSLSTLQSAASAMATQNGWSAGAGTIAVRSPPTSGSHQTALAAEVVLTKTVPRFFSSYFDERPVVVRARSVAIYQNAASACILALNKTASQAVQVQGSSSLTLQGCDVMSNSIANDSVSVWGSGALSADCVASAGKVQTNGGLTLTVCASAVTQAPRARDPFAGLPTPAPGVTRNIPNGHGPFTLQPGSYAGGMSLSGTVTLNPGTYYVSGGDFSVGPNSVVSGSGVTIFLANGSHVTMNNNSTVTLAAPTSGTYSGILFFGDRAGSGNNTFNGTASSHLTGDLYFPSQKVRYLGNYTGVNGCTQIVADTVEWNGNASVAVNCSAAGMSVIPALQAVRVVE